MNKEQRILASLRLFAGFNTQQKAANYFNVCLKTWQRWENNNSAKPYIYELLKFKSGYLQDKEFRFFRIKDGALWTRGGRPISAAQLENLSHLLEWSDNKNPYYDSALKESKITWLKFN